MKIKTATAEDVQLDWMVAHAEELTDDRGVWFIGQQAYWHGPDEGRIELYAPSAKWSQGGQILEREKIHVMYQFTQWRAWGGADGEVSCVGPTPLVAAMRCYVTSKLGEEVEVPDELL